MDCRLCQRGREDLVDLELPGIPALVVCVPCRDELARQGRGEPSPFEPELSLAATHAWAIPLEPDARWLLARAPTLPADAALPAPEAWTAESLPALLEALRGRLGLGDEKGPSPRPAHPGLAAYALAAAIVAGEELGPLERVERIASGADDPMSELLLGVYAHRALRVRLSRLHASEARLRAAIAARDAEQRLAGDLWLRAPAVEALARQLDPALVRLFDAARRAYQYGGASLPRERRGAKDGLGHRATLLLAALLLERGDEPGAKDARTEPSLEGAERRLREVPPGDPRVALLEAATQRLKGWKDGCDRALARVPADDLAAPFQWNRWLRALESGSWVAATAALRAFRALRPHDRRSLLELARLYYLRSMPGVAREVLEASLARRPHDDELAREAREWLGSAREEIERYGAAQDPDAALLFAACQLRLGDPLAALLALEPHLDPERASVQASHLAALCELARGRSEPALEHLSRAFAASAGTPRRARLRGELVRLALDGLREQVLEREELDEDRLRALLESIARHAPVLIEELEQVGGNLGQGLVLTALELIGMTVLAELGDDEQRALLAQLPVYPELTDAGFGFSRFDRAKGGDSLMHAFLALRSLLARRLPEALENDRRLGEHRLPLELLLRFLGRIGSNDEARRVVSGIAFGLLLDRLAKRGVVRVVREGDA